jgi:hypothetical protein
MNPGYSSSKHKPGLFRLYLSAVLLATAVSINTNLQSAENWSLAGSVGIESRWFPNDPQFPNQLHGFQNAFLITPELRYRSDDRRNLVRIVPSLRIDSRDRERNLFDMTELSWTWVGDEWETVLGLNKVFWGVTESRHLVDIINQTDAAEDIDGEEKLGQPMFELTTQRDWGRLSAFLLAGFRERTFPGRVGRLRTPLPIDTDNPQYESGAEEKHVDYALRYAHYLGDWDVGVYVFHGTGREPHLQINATGNALIPIYDQITQIGTDLQFTYEAWLLKFEGIARSGQGDTFAATAAGFEYTLYQIGESAKDLGLLIEYLYDGRDKTAPPVLLQNDVFAGARLSLNDTQDTSLLMGVIVDIEDQSTSFSIEAERRIGDSLTIELETRWFANTATGNPLQSIKDDDYFTLRLRHHF